MIIEAGYDVLELMSASVTHDDESRRGLWVFCMDADLHYLSLRRASDAMTDPLESYVDDIASVLESDFRPVAYFVLGHAVPDTRDSSEGWLHEVDERLRLAPKLAGHELLGRVVFDPEGYFSSVPRYSFRDYPALSDLPRSATVRGPHEFHCHCFACEQHERLLAEIRERNGSSIS
jgi:hypothetical protein